MRPGCFSALLAMVAGLALIIATGRAAGPTTAPAAQPAPTDVIRILLVGDSTVTDAQGWGAGFRKFFDTKVEITNAAKGGRSSKSYRAEGAWDEAITMKADYMLIQFGHNDCPGKGADRETDAKTEFPANMKRYVEEARAAGFKPILVTSLTRRAFDANNKIRPTSLAPYVESTKKVAAELNVPLIDLDARSAALCNELGVAKSEAISQPPKDGKPDITHLNAEGSVLFGKLVVDDLCGLVPELKAHVRAEAH